MSIMPFSTKQRPYVHIDAIAQCTRCKQTSSYTHEDYLQGRSLTCKCGGRLRLFTFNRSGT